MTSLPKTILVFAAALIATLTFSNTATAQRAAIEAVGGQPFGVARLRLDAETDIPGDPWADGRIDVTEAGGRLLYPVRADGPVRRLFRELVQTPGNISVLFLFTGNEPLELTVHTPDPVRLRITPRPFHPNLHRRLLLNWWNEYSRSAARRSRDGDFPGVVDTYLTSMLARRLELRPPSLGPRGLLQPRPDDGLELLLGTERYKRNIQQASLLNLDRSAPTANQPLPQPPAWPAIEFPPVPGDVKVEPIAYRIPEDCFYVRCGTYANYVWIQSIMDQWGGELRNMITEHGVDYEIDPRSERQIALRDTTLGRTLGGTIISDVAIVGADTFFREGAAWGMMFEARNGFFVSQSLNKQRADAVARENGNGNEKTIEIEGYKVHFVSTPDGAVRSYYATDGDYHFVTSSRELVRDFLKLGEKDGKRSLGSTPGFRYARSLVPLSREDRLFVYLSDAWFQRLASPHYHIEMKRRLRSITEMQSLRLAQLAAAAERRPGESVEQMVAARLLSAGFGRRADGSRIVIEDGRMKDSLRGTPGDFIPVPDMPVDKVSAAESQEYASFVRTYQSSASRMDPIVAGVRRKPGDVPGREQVEIVFHVAPLRAAQYQRISQYLGPPREQRMAKLDGDLLRVDGIGPRNNYLFFGLQDFNPPLRISGGRVRWSLPDYGTAQGYLGGAPNLGMLEQLLNFLGQPQSDGDGYARRALGLWQLTTEAMTLLSFKREVLDRVAPQFQFVKTGQPAQVHADLVDISKTQIAAAVNALGYQHARDVSISNTELLHALTRQLHLPREDALAVAQELIGGKLSCTLGGRYQLTEFSDGRNSWLSSGWSGVNHTALTQIPRDYVFPVMQWLRGAKLQLHAQPDILTVRGQIILQHKTAPAVVAGAPGNGNGAPLKSSNDDALFGEEDTAEELPAPKPEKKK